MSADMQDLMARLQMSLGQQANQGPSLYGLQAQQDPNQTAAILKKIQDQAYVSQQGNGPNAGEFGMINSQAKKDAARFGQGIGNLMGVGQPQQYDNSAMMQQRAAIQGGKGQLADALAQPGADPLQTRVDVLSKLAQSGVPGAADALAKAQDDLIKMQTSKATAFKDTAQGNAATDEIQNRAQQRDMDQKRLAQSTAKDTWTTIGQGGGYIVQKNGLGEISTKKNQDAASSQAASVTPTGLASILDYFHQNNKMPANLPKGVVGKAWEAEAQYQQQTGNIAASYAAQAASTKANTDALVQTQKSLSATTSYMNTMDKNIKQAENLSKELDFGDVKKLNGAYQSWLSGTSDPKYAAYNLYFSSVASEFAKIKSGSFGNTPVSDSLQHQAMEDLNKQAGGLAPQALFDAVRVEGQNRVTSLQAERDDLAGRIGKGGGFRPAGQAPGATPPAATPAVQPPPAVAPLPAASSIPEGQTATNKQTGQKVIFKGGAWVPVT